MPRRIQTVLIGTSLTAASDDVVRGGLALARAAGARVVLAHAFTMPLVYGGSGAPFPELPPEEVLRAEQASLQRRLEAQVERLGIGPAECAAIRVEMGPPHRIVTETARQTGADLIVVGPAESPRLARFFGSTADRVVRRATCPVLVLRGNLTVPPARVLLPVDLSPLSADAFHWGLDALAQLDPARRVEVEALHVVTDIQIEAAGYQRVTAGEVTERAARELDRLAVRHGAGWQVATRTRSGFIDREILARIHDWRPDLVIVGTHGGGGFERLLLGSVASSVVRHAEVSVLVVPPEAALKESLALEAEARATMKKTGELVEVTA